MLLVQIVEPSGQVTSGDTGAKGDYELPAPKNGPYLIVFREPQTKAPARCWSAHARYKSSLVGDD